MEARSASEFLVLLVTVSRYRYQVDEMTGFGLTKSMRDLQSVQTRHREVEQHNIRLELLGKPDSSKAVITALHLMSHSKQQHRGAVGRIRIVVHYENAAHELSH